MADVHFDMPFTMFKGNRKFIEKRRIEHRQIFKDTIDFARETAVDFLFIAGDLFEQKYVKDETIKYIISLFNSIPDVKIFISPGNHDPLTKTSPYNTYSFPPNVIIFKDKLEKYSFEDVDIYGVGFSNYEVDSIDLKSIDISSDKTNILVTHGTLSRCYA
jgi:DNA repair exonuclease SbcCD nuclease subunit